MDTLMPNSTGSTTPSDAFRWHRWADAIRARTDVKPTTKLVADTLASHASNDDGACYPSEARIAECCGLMLTTRTRTNRFGDVETWVENRAVQTAIRQLKNLGALEERSRGAGSGTEYVLRSFRTPVRNEDLRTGVRNDADVRTDVRTSAQLNGSAPHGHTEAPRTVVRGELPIRTAQTELLDVATPSSGDDVSAIFAHWQDRCRHPTAKLTRDRRTKIEARLRDGYSIEDLRRAIEGAAVAAFVNDAGHRFDDIELICRSGSKLEGFIQRAERAESADAASDRFARFDNAYTEVTS